MCGYYGEKIVLKAQELGLNTCWVAVTYSKVKNAFEVGKDEKLCCLIALGYGAHQGNSRPCKPMETLCRTDGEMPDWFRSGMEAAMLAPTAMNQQKFLVTLEGNKVDVQPGKGLYTGLDTGIVRYHFEVGAGSDSGQWEWATS